jgi:hypothetical protein
LDNKIDVRQYARKGHSTTDAMLYLLQAIFEAIDRGNTAARIVFADFSKGFDLIDHNILLREWENLSVSPVLIRWIAAFLTDIAKPRTKQRNETAKHQTKQRNTKRNSETTRFELFLVKGINYI